MSASTRARRLDHEPQLLHTFFPRLADAKPRRGAQLLAASQMWRSLAPLGTIRALVLRTSRPRASLGKTRCMFPGEDMLVRLGEEVTFPVLSIEQNIAWCDRRSQNVADHGQRQSPPRPIASLVGPRAVPPPRTCNSGCSGLTL